MTYIKITEEMKDFASKEAIKRDAHIKHHFEVKHFSSHKRNIVGFLGEFAACELLGLDWKKNIREDYLTIDNGDGTIHAGVYDVKTETVPNKFLHRVATRSVLDDEVYGRRLINKGQVKLLNNYDIVIFGVFDRDDLTKWFPIGWLETEYILKNYEVTRKRPDGNFYPYAALPIKTSDLRPMKSLFYNR